MKDKNVAAILALFLGWMGVHRFYLGQIGLGIVYILLAFTTISFWLSLIDMIAFFVMDRDNFDLKYNRKHVELRRREGTDFDRNARRPTARTSNTNRPTTVAPRSEARQRPAAGSGNQRSSNRARSNPKKSSGIQKYKDFDYRGAVADFLEALETDPNDVTLHFNIACAYSLLEQADKAFIHLDKAVALGFRSHDKIKEHDALAFLRIQDEFEAFNKNNFRLAPEKLIDAKEQGRLESNLLDTQPDLLDQLNKLAELRQKGLLTEQEFDEQKRRLMD